MDPYGPYGVCKFMNNIEEYLFNACSMPSPTSKTLRFSANPNKSTTEDLGDSSDGSCPHEELGNAGKVV